MSTDRPPERPSNRSLREEYWDIVRLRMFRFFSCTIAGLGTLICSLYAFGHNGAAVGWVTIVIAIASIVLGVRAADEKMSSRLAIALSVGGFVVAVLLAIFAV